MSRVISFELDDKFSKPCTSFKFKGPDNEDEDEDGEDDI